MRVDDVHRGGQTCHLSPTADVHVLCIGHLGLDPVPEALLGTLLVLNGLLLSPGQMLSASRADVLT